MTFVHQNKDVGVFISDPVFALHSLKLIYDGSDDRSFTFFNEAKKVFTRGSFFCRFAAGLKGAPYLIIQINAVGYNDNTGIGDGRV